MDGDEFFAWVYWWYEEVKNKSNGPWLLILDNCSGHDELQELENVTYFFLPANTTATYQPLDQGVISQTKIKYRSIICAKLLISSPECSSPITVLLEIDISEMRSQDTCNTHVCKLSHSTHM